jgi:hypothetical protein
LREHGLPVAAAGTPGAARDAAIAVAVVWLTFENDQTRVPVAALFVTYAAVPVPAAVTAHRVEAVARVAEALLQPAANHLGHPVPADHRVPPVTGAGDGPRITELGQGELAIVIFQPLHPFDRNRHRCHVIGVARVRRKAGWGRDGGCRRGARPRVESRRRSVRPGPRWPRCAGLAPKRKTAGYPQHQPQRGQPQGEPVEPSVEQGAHPADDNIEASRRQSRAHAWRPGP